MRRAVLLAIATIALAPPVGMYAYGGAYLAVPIIAYLIVAASTAGVIALLFLAWRELADGIRAVKHKPVEPERGQ